MRKTTDMVCTLQKEKKKKKAEVDAKRILYDGHPIYFILYMYIYVCVIPVQRRRNNRTPKKLASFDA